MNAQMLFTLARDHSRANYWLASRVANDPEHRYHVEALRALETAAIRRRGVLA